MQEVLYRIHHCYCSSSVVHGMSFKRETESLKENNGEFMKGNLFMKRNLFMKGNLAALTMCCKLSVMTVNLLTNGTDSDERLKASI